MPSLINKNIGFTLVELLVVISIISVLSSVVLTNVANARSLGNDAFTKEALNQIRNALTLYYQDNGYFPGETSSGNSEARVYLAEYDTNTNSFKEAFNLLFTGKYIPQFNYQTYLAQFALISYQTKTKLNLDGPTYCGGKRVTEYILLFWPPSSTLSGTPTLTNSSGVPIGTYCIGE